MILHKFYNRFNLEVLFIISLKPKSLQGKKLEIYEKKYTPSLFTVEKKLEIRN